MGMVNKVEVGGGIGPSGGLSALAGQAMSLRQSGGPPVTTDPSVPQGLQGTLPGMRPNPGAGKQWQQEQREFASIESSLSEARTNVEMEQAKIRMQIERAMRDGRHDIEGQLREKLDEMNTSLLDIDERLGKHQFLSGAVYSYFSGAHETPAGPNGEKELKAGVRSGEVHKRFKAYQLTKMNSRNGMRSAVTDALALALGEVQSAVAKVGTPAEKLSDSISDAVDPRLVGVRLWTEAAGAAAGVYKRMTGGEGYADEAEAMKAAAAEAVNWVGSFSNAIADTMSEQHRGSSSVQMRSAVEAFTGGLYKMAMLEDNDQLSKETIRGHALDVGDAIRKMKALGVTDLEIDAIRDQFVDTGQVIDRNINGAMVSQAAQEMEDASGDRRHSAMKHLGDPALKSVASKLRLMGSELDNLKHWIGEEKWDPSYAVTNFSHMDVSEDWFANSIPRITAEYLANNGELDENKVIGFMNEFDKETQKEILSFVKKDLHNASTMLKEHVAAEGYDPDDLFAVDHKEQIKMLSTKRNDLTRQLSKLEYNTEASLNEMGDAAQDEVMALMEQGMTEIADIDAKMAELSVLTDPAMDLIAMQKERLAKGRG